MSDSTFSSWRDLILAEDKMDRLNRNTDAVVAIIHCSRNPSSNMVFDYLKDDPHLVMLSVEQVTGDIALLHHIQEVSGGIGLNFKSKACLKGWGSSATALQLEDRLFSESVTVICPTKENLWNADSAGSFKNVDPASDNEARSFAFRGMIPIPPFAAMSIINLGQSMP